MRPNLEDVALDPLFESLANEFDPQALETGNRLEWPKETWFVHSERALFEQVLRNLISNAIRHTVDGSIKVLCRDHSNAIVISVMDTGSGVPAEALGTIFEEFQQLDTPNNANTKGLGLGLSIAKRAAALLGCEISVESQLKKGSTFSIAVPKGNAVNIVFPTEDVTLKGTTLDQPYVILSDDDPLVLEGLCDLVSAWEYQSVTGVDIDSVVHQLASRDDHPIAIISDHGLVDARTGIDAIQIIRKLFGSSIPALLVTGDINLELLAELDSGSSRFCTSQLLQRNFVRSCDVQNKHP